MSLDEALPVDRAFRVLNTTANSYKHLARAHALNCVQTNGQKTSRNI